MPPAGAARTPLAPLSGSANPKGKKAQKQPPSPSGTCQRTGSTLGHPPSGGGQCCSSLLILPNTPTPKPTSPSPTPGCSRQLQVRVVAAETIERPVELEAKAQVVCLGVVGGEEALDAPCAPPLPAPVGLGQHRRPGLRPAPRSSPAPAARQARVPYVARPSNRGDQPAPSAGTQAPSRRPSTPLPHPGTASVCPGRALPFSADKEPGT